MTINDHIAGSLTIPVGVRLCNVVHSTAYKAVDFHNVWVPICRDAQARNPVVFVHYSVDHFMRKFC